MSIRAARENAGYSQADVAKMMDVAQSAVSGWETGKTLPRASMLPKLAGIFGCSVDFLLEQETPIPAAKA